MLMGCDSLEIGDGTRVANLITPLRERARPFYGSAPQYQVKALHAPDLHVC